MNSQLSTTRTARSFSRLGHCPVCAYETFVALYRDGYLAEVGVGHCFVCSYERTSQVAEEIATDIRIRRAIKRSD